jgi:competence protein ComEC
VEIFEDIKQHPVFRLLFPFVIGIVAAMNFRIAVPDFILLISVFVLLILSVVCYKLSGNLWNINWLFGVVIYLAFFWLGFILTMQHAAKADLQIHEASGKIIGMVEEEPKPKEKSVQIKLKVEAYQVSSDWYSTDGYIQLFLEKTLEAESLKPGDRIIFNPDLKQYQNSGNPAEFDYEKYLWQHLIAYSDYLEGVEWTKTESYQKNNIKRFAQNIRNSLIEIYTKNGLEGDELAVATALTLGNKSSLSDNVRQSYSISGGMHVLAVSGLHVGIVFLVINSLMSFIKKREHLWIKTLIVILLIWFYAFITGLSPSVTRASLMFSLFALGKIMKRNPGFLNIISVSAIISLIINPFAITEIGFQLSYAAVASIVFFYSRIYNLLIISNKLIDKLWSLVAVSVAAQIGTLPLSLYYFNQFSNYFILTNILLIPLVSVAIYSAILLVIFSPIAFLSAFIGSVFSFVIKTMNYGVSFIENLPGSYSEIYIDKFQFLLIILIILLLLLLLEYRRTKLVFPLLLCIILFFSDSLLNNIKQISQRDFVIYNLRNTSVINFIDARDNIIFTGIESNIAKGDDRVFAKYKLQRGLEKEKVVFLEHLKPDYILRNIVSIDNPHIFIKYGLVKFYNLRMAIVGNDLPYPRNPSQKIDVDYIVITGYRGYSAKYIFENFNFKTVIIDSSVADYYADELMEQISSEGFDVFNVKKSGAFIYSNSIEI